MNFFQKQIPIFALFLISVSLLMTQILFLHFSRPAFPINTEFIILSFAILGIGLGTFIVYARLNNRDNQDLGKFFFPASLGYTLFSVVPFFILHLSNFYPQFLVAALFFVSELILYSLGGILIGLTFRYYAKSRGIYFVYFLNMIGSGVGALLVILWLDSLGFYVIIANLIIALIVSFLYVVSYKFFKVIPVLIFFGVTTLLFSNQLVSQFKVICDPNNKLMASATNSFSQVDLYSVNVSQGSDKGQSSSKAPADLPPSLYQIRFECFRVISLPNYDSLNDIKYYLSTFPYLVSSYDKVVILGSGGGSEVAGAVLNGTRRVVAVEINPLVISNVYLANPNNIYQNTAVELVLREGRDYMATTREKFDLIYVPTSKNFGTFGLKPYALQENYLYAKEAMQSYVGHLSDHGTLAIIDSNDLITEYLLTVKAAVLTSGKNPTDVIVVEGDKQSTILYKNGGFNEGELNKINQQAEQLGFKVSANQNNLPDSPVITFDRPYLRFNTLLGIGAAVPLQDLIYLTVILSVFYFVFLLVVYFKDRFVKGTRFIPGLFTFTGVGFIGVELYLIEKTSLMLGHPSFSIAFALALMLVFGGLGNLLAQKLQAHAVRINAGTIAMLLIYLVSFDQLIILMSSADFWMRLVVAIPLLVIPSLGMGILFAICLRRAQILSEKLLPLVLTIDGLASVLGGTLFKVTVLFIGFSGGLMIGIVSYAGILLILRNRK